MHWIKAIEQWLEVLATLMPLDLFVFVGSLIEELIGPIPSTLVMTTAGVLAHLDGRTLVYVAWLALLGSLGKTLGTYVYYIIGDKLEDKLVKKYGGFFGLQHEEIEKIGKRFGSHHWKDGGVLFLLRAIPFFPTIPVSIACGVIKMDWRVYLWATYLGTLLKDFVYVYSGFAGVVAMRRLLRDVIEIHQELNLFIIVLGIGFLVLLYWQRHHGVRLARYLHRRFSNGAPPESPNA